MFEDLGDYIKKQNSTGGKSPVPGDEREAHEVAEHIALIMAEHGIEAGVGEVGGTMAMSIRATNATHVSSFMRNMSRIAIDIGVAAGMKPSCLDAASRELHDGDFIKVSNDLGKPAQLKKVLKVGFGYCLMSLTDDFEKEDGPWFQSYMVDRNMLRFDGGVKVKETKKGKK